MPDEPVDARETPARAVEGYEVRQLELAVERVRDTFEALSTFFGDAVTSIGVAFTSFIEQSGPLLRAAIEHEKQLDELRRAGVPEEWIESWDETHDFAGSEGDDDDR